MRPTPRQRQFMLRAKGTGIGARGLDRADIKLANLLLDRCWLNLIFEGGSRTLVLSRLGEAALREPAPPPPWGRIACVNPICGKTAAQEKHPGCETMICGACFKQVPALRQQYRDLHARWRKAERAWKRRDGGATDVFDILRERLDANWAAIVAAFTAPEKPEGLETFLEEMGWHAEEQDDEQHDGSEAG